MDKKENQGGRLAANVRRANIAEGIAMQMFRPFAAIAPVPREEDHGIDFIATLIRRDGRVFSAEDSFVVQVKTHTAARFCFAGDGVKWLRQLRLPYFPVVANLDEATVSLYTLNLWHMPIHSSVVNRYEFCVCQSSDDCENCDGMDDFPLEEPLMKWSIKDCGHPDFPEWAYKILKAAISIETDNFQFGPLWRFTELIGGPFLFDPDNPIPTNLPRAGDVQEIPPGGAAPVLRLMGQVIGPFANWASNCMYEDDRSADLLMLRDAMRRLGLDPDPTGRWDILAQEMGDHFKGK